MAKKNKVQTYGTLAEAVAHLTVKFMKTKDFKKYYSTSTPEEVMTTNFDIINAVRLNPSVFPTAPHIVNGVLVGELYLINKKPTQEQMETIWNYEWDGTLAKK